MNRRRSISPLALATSALAFMGFGWGGLAHGQYAVQPAPARPYYQPAQPRYGQRAATLVPRRKTYTSQVLPYNRTPYTDDWSTARHLPFPKPWMLPTRDPAARGR